MVVDTPEEKEFRETLKKTDWEQYRDRQVAVYCSADAIIPVWAYMLIAAQLEPVASFVYYGSPDEMEKQIFLDRIRSIEGHQYEGQRVVIKGCGDTPIGHFAYAAITGRLRPHVKSIMYGEPCSTVPVFKKK